jgi:hypothetical protein
MMAQRAAVHAGGDRLLRGEISRLCLCLPIESIVIYVRHIEDISTQIHDYLALSGTASMSDQQLEDRFGLLPPKLVIQGRSGHCLLNRHLGLQVSDRVCGAAAVAGSPALPIPDTSTSAGLGSQAVLSFREQICSMK